MNKYILTLLMLIFAPVSLWGMRRNNVRRVHQHASQVNNNNVAVQIAAQEAKELNIALQASLKDHENRAGKEDILLKQALHESLESFNNLTINQNNNAQTDEELARILQMQDDAALAHQVNAKETTLAIRKSRPAYNTTTTATSQKNISSKTVSNRHVECIKAVSQKDATCGMHAACNAMAIYLLLTQNKEINELTVAELNQALQRDWLPEVTALNLLQAQSKNKGNVPYNDLETKDIASVIEQMKYKNFSLRDINIFFLNNKMEWSGTITGYDHEQTVNQHAYEIALKEFKAKDHGVVSFICNPGGHWVTICAVKTPGKEPRLYYMDSANGGSVQSKEFFAFILPKIL